MHELPKLEYEYDALEPHIDEKTMKIHHTKHHQTYIDKLNGAVKGTEFEDMDVNELLQKFDSLPDDIKGAVKNHGGGHSNHSMFWQLMKIINLKIKIKKEIEEILKQTKQRKVLFIFHLRFQLR